ncbi:MAG: hypothetical protein QM619_04265 [Micropruina sp.]|uniref:hypothetical protein n=1 Tax=Micropruina sp. TaxID=2737536 RepID=UPI0039E513B8
MTAKLTSSTGGHPARSLRLPDGSRARLDGPLQPGVPLVLLLHGFRGGLASMATAPEGRQSWREALLASGFSTLSYEQAAPDGLLAPNLEQLVEIAAGPLSHDSRLRRLPLAIVAHSRGGLLARLLLDRAAGSPGLHRLLDRMRSVITLHTPHAGSGLAGLAVGVDRTARRLQTAVSSLGLRPTVLAALCSLSASPAVAELAPGSPTLRALAGRPTPAGIPWHTFGGVSADLRRICELLGPAEPDGRASAPARLARTRGLTEMLGVLDRLALLSPALRDGEGDVVVADACARLPFAASHTVNRLTHVEALWDAGLHAQVIELLRGRSLLAVA